MKLEIPVTKKELEKWAKYKHPDHSIEQYVKECVERDIKQRDHDWSRR